MRTAVAGQLLLVELNENGVLSDAFDLIPGNDQIVLSAPSKQSAASGDHERKYPCILAVEFKISRIPEASSVAQIDDLQMPQISGADAFHSSPPLR